MEAIILAGGLGTRLSSRISDRPKAMAPVAGRPFLQILLDRLIDLGFDRVILSVGHLHQAIIDRFGSGYRSVAISYVVEETPLGTGGGIRLALESALEGLVLVLNGDTYLDVDFSAMMAAHRDAKCPITMAVTLVENVERYGGVMLREGQIVGFIEKGSIGPGWINAGAYVLDRRFPWPERLPPRFSFETDVLIPSLDLIRPAAFECKGYFLDIGIPEDLDRAQKELASRK